MRAFRKFLHYSLLVLLIPTCLCAKSIKRMEKIADKGIASKEYKSSIEMYNAAIEKLEKKVNDTTLINLHNDTTLSEKKKTKYIAIRDRIHIKRSSAYFSMGDLLFKENKYKDALDTYYKIELINHVHHMLDEVRDTLQNKLFKVYMEAGDSSMRLGDFASAIAYYLEISEIDKKTQFVYDETLHLSGLSLNLGWKLNDKILAQQNRLISAYKKYADQFFNDFKSYTLASQNYTACLMVINNLTIFSEVTQTSDGKNLDELKTNLQEKIGDCYFEQGEFVKAAEEYQSILLHEKAILSYTKAEAWGALAHYYEKSSQDSLAAVFYEKDTQWNKAAQLYAKLKLYDKAIASYKIIKEWEKIGELYLQTNKLLKAAGAFEKGELFILAGETYKKARKPWSRKKWATIAAKYEKKKNNEKAAKAYHYAGKKRNAAQQYMNAGMYAEAADIYRALCKKDIGIGVRLNAARCYSKAGNTDNANLYYKKALGLAKKYNDLIEVLNISYEQNAFQSGLDYVNTIARKYESEGEIFKAYDTHVKIISFFKGNYVALLEHSNALVKANEACDKLKKKYDSYPKVVSSEGTNYMNEWGGLMRCGVKGALKNVSSKTIKSVEIKVDLFIKDQDYLFKLSNSSSSKGIADTFNRTKAGYSHIIKLYNLAPGETKNFSDFMHPAVVYKKYSTTVQKLKWQ